MSHPDAPLVRPLTSNERVRRSWSVAIDGRAVDASFVEIASPRFGTLRYGMTEGGFDGWSFAERGSGGAVVLPYSHDDGRLLIGLVEETRHNLGGAVLSAPRGFVDPGEDHLTAARRELLEETGYRADTIVELAGQPANPNSSFFETAGADDGVRFFAAPVPLERLVPADGGLRFRSEALESVPGVGLERIGRAWFIGWRDAIGVKDMMTAAGVARLLAHLAGDGGPPP